MPCVLPREHSYETSNVRMSILRGDSVHRPVAATNLRLLSALYAGELAMLLFVVAFYRLGDRPLFSSLLPTTPGRLALAAFVTAAASAVVIACEYQKSRASTDRRFGLTVMMNAVTLCGLFIMGELTIRLFSDHLPTGPVFLKTRLPASRTWRTEIARNSEFMAQASGHMPYLIRDEVTGWRPGPNRRTADGLAFSSTEGIRSPRAAMAFADIPARSRIALVGDSFAFSDDVTYEESWGYQLQQLLGPDFQVLNFGVTGYGVDQAYLRYVRDVRPWHPDIVIFGFIDNDFIRSMTVYNFITYPEWNTPFSKPRFVVRGGRLAALNLPALHPQEIFSKHSIAELPFLEYDKGYNGTDWRRYAYHFSYLTRFLSAIFAPWGDVNDEISDEATQTVNVRLLQSFISLAVDAGSIPILAYFPTYDDLYVKSLHRQDDRTLAQLALQKSDIPHQDLTGCLPDLNVSTSFTGNGHYTPALNARVARCLYRAILVELAGRDESADGGLSRPVLRSGPENPR